ncbi:hypothetical protein ACN27E_07915 [Mycobacterium sp. WMMD1722]|uniref:hypothetical protein n=1 Tax=Mycobacterium sp. WMMD1722 TaxID=3404117 RepID=UPI003BF4B329
MLEQLRREVSQLPAMFEIEMQFTTEGGSKDDPARFEDFLDSVIDEFAKQGFDVDYTAVASTLEASFTIEVADGSERGLLQAVTALQIALTAVGVEADLGHEVKSTRNLALA